MQNQHLLFSSKFSFFVFFRPLSRETPTFGPFYRIFNFQAAQCKRTNGMLEVTVIFYRNFDLQDLRDIFSQCKIVVEGCPRSTSMCAERNHTLVLLRSYRPKVLRESIEFKSHLHTLRDMREPHQARSRHCRPSLGIEHQLNFTSERKQQHLVEGP